MTLTLEQYESLNCKDIVYIKDIDFVDNGFVTSNNRLKAQIENIRKFKDDEEIVELIIYDLITNKDNKLFLIIKIIGQEAEFKLCYQPVDVPVGTRQDLIDKNNLWLFEAPDDENNYALSELVVARIIHYDKDILYELKDEILYGIVDGKDFASIAEWSANKNCDNPELFYIEIGGVDKEGNSLPAGGIINFYEGILISSSNISL